MRLTVLMFIFAEIMDYVTTIIAIRMGARELNPIAWDWLMPLKILITILIAAFLQLKKPAKWDLAVPIWASIAPAWNAVMILMML